MNGLLACRHNECLSLYTCYHKITKSHFIPTHASTKTR